MRVLINKAGRQTGPHTLEEARALVLSGQIAATDWAWPDGATQWIALKDVPGFAGTATGVNPPPLTPPAPSPLDEQELWRGRPSQLLNLKLYLGWTIVLLGVSSGAVVVGRADIWYVLAGLAGLALFHITLRNLRLRAVEYVVTTQRVRVVSGLLNKNIAEIELFRVKDTSVHQRFIQRLFGLGTITILSGDARSPVLILRGIPHAIDLRERLRHEVMLLRQRYGVREMDVM